jgi:hypothetical protein
MTTLQQVEAARPSLRSEGSRMSALGVAVMAVVSVAMLAGLVLRVLNFPMRKDELLYVPPIRLLDNNRIYEDFFYNHVPGSAWFFYGLHKLTGSDHLLLTGRIGVLVGWAVLILAVAFVSWALTRSVFASWAIAVLAACDGLFMQQTGMTATNNFLPLPLVYIGLGLMALAISEEKAEPWPILFAGIALGLATSMKISAGAFIPAAVLVGLIWPRSYGFGRRFGRILLPLAVGGVIGGLPILIPFANHPESFLAHVVRYHTGPHLEFWRTATTEEGAALGTAAKLVLAQRLWLDTVPALGLAALIAVVGIGLRAEPGSGLGQRPVPDSSVVLLILAALLGTAMSLMPTPSFPQYFAQPIVLIPLALGLAVGGLGTQLRHRIQPILAGAAVIAAVSVLPYLVQYAPVALKPERWEVLRVHGAGVAIAKRLQAAGVKGKVATLWPVYPLEGRLPVYPELATGPFAYRTADLTAPDIAQFYRQTSPTKVTALLESDPPAALLTGFDAALEAPLVAYAQKNGYVADETLGIQDRYGKPVLWIKPAAAPAPAAPGG